MDMSGKKELSGVQRSFLLKKAHDLNPVVMIGKNGLTDPVFSAIEKGLEDHELIKLKFIGFKVDRRELSLSITEKTNSILIKIIGNIAYFYKQSMDENKRCFHLPENK